MAESDQTGTGTDAQKSVATAVKTKPSNKNKPKQLPPYNVILLDDDDHSYEYVIEMLQKLFGHPLETAFLMAQEVDSSGRVIVCTTHRERAELKRDQILGYGPDKLIASCQGAMTAVIEPAPG